MNRLFPLPGTACMLSLSRVRLLVTPWTVACQALLSMGFSRQECWSGLPFPPSGYLPNPGIKPTSLGSPALASDFFTTASPGKPPTFLLAMSLRSPQWSLPHGGIHHSPFLPQLSHLLCSPRAPSSRITALMAMYDQCLCLPQSLTSMSFPRQSLHLSCFHCSSHCLPMNICQISNNNNILCAGDFMTPLLSMISLIYSSLLSPFLR